MSPPQPAAPQSFGYAVHSQRCAMCYGAAEHTYAEKPKSLTEIAIEDVCVMRQCNDWQVHRIMRMADRQNQAIAWAAFGAGMTLQQSKRLVPEKQREAIGAYDRLTDSQEPPPLLSNPHASIALDEASEAEMAEWGHRLLQVKADLPRGHFVPWIEEKSEITYSQALRWMRAAKEAYSSPTNSNSTETLQGIATVKEVMRT